METQKIILKGKDYIGKFSANKEQKELYGGERFIETAQDYYRWEGIGQIENSKTKESYGFSLITKWNRALSEERKGLLESLVLIKRKELNETPDARVVDQQSVYDLVLKEMYEDIIKGRENNEPRSKISPKALLYEELVDKGLVAKEEL